VGGGLLKTRVGKKNKREGGGEEGGEKRAPLRRGNFSQS
jgi:hypothetical protein